MIGEGTQCSRMRKLPKAETKTIKEKLDMLATIVTLYLFVLVLDFFSFCLEGTLSFSLALLSFSSLIKAFVLYKNKSSYLSVILCSLAFIWSLACNELGRNLIFCMRFSPML